jgi:hypothetical protein
MTVKDQTLTETAPRLRGMVPLSVVIHTDSNPELLAETITACSKNAGGCELEFVVVHGGSVLADVEQCRRTLAEMSNISWQALATREEHDPRNLGAREARYDHVLFLGDGVRPASDDFFRVHASLHRSCSEKDFAVLGAIENDAPFNLGRFLESGRQLASANPVPSTFLSPCYFSDSNISIKKSLVQDWLADGFSHDFPGSVGAVELAYRLSERCSRNLKILYEPSARATRHPVHALSEMFGPQVQLGRLLRLFIDRYPEALQSLGLEAYGSDWNEAAPASDYFTIIEGLKAWARIVDRRAGVQTESWYSGFAQSILEVCLFQGYSAPGPAQTIPAAPGRLILERFMRRLRLLLHDELAFHAGQFFWGIS